MTNKIKLSEIKKYRASPYGKKIELVIVERETQSSIWIRGSRMAKRNTFFDTWEDAKDYLLSEAARKLSSARTNLQYAQDRYGNIKGLRQDK
jgi:hypothetical protein